MRDKNIIPKNIEPNMYNRNKMNNKNIIILMGNIVFHPLTRNIHINDDILISDINFIIYYINIQLIFYSCFNYFLNIFGEIHNILKLISNH